MALHARSVHARYLRWQDRHISPGLILVLVSLVLGLFTGIAAAALKRLIHFIDSLVLPGLNLGTPNPRLLIWPLAGILLTAIYQRYVVRGNVARGTWIIKQDLEQKRYKLRPLTIFSPLVGCSLTIGFGASAGSEGPTALSGAAIGSNVGRWFGLSPQWLRLLVGIGGGAGIAAIFKSPMGGVLFTLEVLQMPMTTLPVIALVLACLISSATAYVLSNFTFDIQFTQTAAMDPATLGWILLLGLFCGLYSIYYNFTKRHATHWFTHIKRPWVAALVTGSLLSLGVFLFPTLYGEGFRVITGLVNGTPMSFTAAGIMAGHSGLYWMIAALCAILALKGILVAASYSGGGVAGDFVPTFFAGAVAGFLFATCCNHWLGTTLPEWYFALAAMGCVMAGTVHAPLMALFILCETTNTYAYLFPYLLAIAVSYGTVKLLTPRSWYGETGHDDIMALMGFKGSPDLREPSVQQREDRSSQKLEDRQNLK